MVIDKKRVLRDAVLEILSVVFFVVLIIGALNYFNILPVSSRFTFLSFLPTQGAVGTQGKLSLIQNRNFNTLSIIMPWKPLKIENKSDKAEFPFIASSAARLVGKSARIDIELFEYGKANESGVIFFNGEKYGSKSYRSIRIYRNISGEKNEWMLEYRGGKKNIYKFLARGYKTQDFRRLSILLSPNGKNLIVIPTGSLSKSLVLPDSFYSDKGVVNAVVQVAPSSVVLIYSLYYQYN